MRPGRQSQIVPPGARKSVAPRTREIGGAQRTQSVIPPPPKAPRKFGLRGAAPWALRHAERQAAEASGRNREPPKPGSARATLRTPKPPIASRLPSVSSTTLSRSCARLQKNLNEGFFELERNLHDIEGRNARSRGLSNIETFAERELGLGKGLAHKLVRIPSRISTCRRQALKLEALGRAIDAIDQAPQTQAANRVAKLPLKPPR